MTVASADAQAAGAEAHDELTARDGARARGDEVGHAALGNVLVVEVETAHRIVVRARERVQLLEGLVAYEMSPEGAVSRPHCCVDEHRHGR